MSDRDGEDETGLEPEIAELARIIGRSLARAHDAAERGAVKAAAPEKCRVVPDVANYLARILVEIHGESALGVAERASSDIRALGLRAKAAEWEQVIAAIKAITQPFA